MTEKLLIPGTGGATFKTSAGAQLGSIVDIIKHDASQLRCEHADPTSLAPTKTSGVDGVSIVADGYLSGVYDPFTHGTPAYSVFNYDWRLDLRLSAQRLCAYFESYNQQWDVVCHSQGGLVLAVAAHQLAAAGKSLGKYVRRVVMVGVPLFGTVNSLAGILNGVSVGATVPADVVRTWPSVHQMLPLWNIGTNLMAPQLYLNLTWSQAGLFPTAGAPDLTQHIDPAMLDRARAYRSLHDVSFFEALRPIGGMMFVFGKNSPTRLRAPKFPTLPSVAALADPDVVRGDTLVPCDLTWKLVPAWMQQAAGAPEYLDVSEHMFMCNELPTYQLCQTYFSQP